MEALCFHIRVDRAEGKRHGADLRKDYLEAFGYSNSRGTVPLLWCRTNLDDRIPGLCLIALAKWYSRIARLYFHFQTQVVFYAENWGSWSLDNFPVSLVCAQNIVGF